MVQVSRNTLLDALERDTRAFAVLLREHDLATRIATCPDFDLAGLASHLGGIHLWGTACLAASEPPPRPPSGPGERDPLVTWYVGAARRLLDALRATNPATPCVTFGEPHTAAFWVRRQAHETAMHLWDAQSAVAVPEPLDPTLAADGVAEVLTVFVPRQVALGRTAPVTRPIALEATDTGDTWTVGAGDPVATVRGPAASLLLLLWKRTSLNNPALQVDGDPAPTFAADLTP